MLSRFSILLICLTPLAAAQTDFASERLLGIANKEEKIYKKIAEDPEFYSATDLDRHIQELVDAYRSYLADNPDDPSAYILYGKLLRRLDENEQAFESFLKADELDPNIAVVKQQIGTHLAEQGKGKAALTFYLRAVDLEPETAVYHFALGQLLYRFRDDFLKENIFTRDALDREMLRAFRQAAVLEPENFDFQMRLGEAYYDLASPDWKAALLHWKKLAKTADSDLRLEIIHLHQARTLGKLGRYEEAQELADTVQTPGLQYSKNVVLDEIRQH
ncbi:tetratricopeptide repeat protein [Coraliomargarita parva]|uniref:tetratricopeptide repeat protein n=1 Tax=Coraliomargarita parva TaxID=3014050 RepID=UPI0022B2F418|nr:tetratricopeptide repeat protein [Coraliomargarita parva]